MVDKALLRSKIKELTEIYDKNKGRAESERDVCRVFIEPLFEALDWKVRSLDEVHEQKNQPQGRPDYIFYIDGSIVFYLEAKKFKVLDEDDIKQALNYARNKGKRWAVLSNFEETIILICDTQESSLQQHIFRRIPYQNLENNIDDLLLLSKASFKDNVIDKKAEEEGRIKKTIKIDEELLDDILNWQEMLIKSIKKHNTKEYKKEVLQEIAQILLNRIIFIRTAEDRKNEARSDETIKSILNVYEQFNNISIRNRINKLFEEYDEIYDSKLFTYEENNFKNRHECEKVEIGNKTYYKILKGTYDKNKIYSYRFDAIDADVLGSMYEKYIGSIQEYRKQQGIYYTPIWVVSYIVNNTLGSFIENETKADINKVKVLDMACGSGSFLLKAYDVFDEYYKSNLKKYLQSGLDLNSDATKITQKTKILREHIFAVDLDIKAVEIAQLNLLLKIAETRYRLPDLKNNIKEGNSLVDDSSVDTKYAFIWKDQFKSIMDNGGFDIIIGNPPYSFTRDADFTSLVKEYATKTYFSGLDSVSKSHARQSGKINLYSLFLIKGIQLLADDGVLGFIIPNNLLRTTTYDIVRKYILDNCKILQIVDLGTGVFKDATVSTTIIIVQKEKRKEVRDKNKTTIIYNIKDLSKKDYETHAAKQGEFLDNTSYAFNITVNKDQRKIMNKIEQNTVNLGEESKYIIEGIVGNLKRDMVDSPINSKCKKFLVGRDISKYKINYKNKYIIYDKNRLHRARPEEVFTSDKIIIQRIGGGDMPLACVLDTEGYYTFASTNLILLKDDSNFDLRYITGLLNSKLINWYYANKFTNRSKLTVNISKTFLEKIPIRKADKEHQKPIIKLVNELLELNKKSIADNTNTKISNKDKINEKLDEVDELVYDLYKLTEDDKKDIREFFKV
jgi:type I restriction-modification system DNA methylase subunit